MSGSTLQKQLIKQTGLILLAASFAFGQVDVPNNSRNALIDLGRKLAWGSGGRGNLHNAYIFTPVSPSESFCLAIGNNNPTNAHTFNVTVATTSDQQVVSYLTAPGSTRWISATAITGASVAASSSYYNFFRINGASRVAVVISGSTTQAGTPDTADVMIGQSTFLDANGTSCTPGNYAQQFIPGNSDGTAGNCPNVASFTLSAGTDVRIVTGTAGHTVKICHLEYASDTSADVTFRQGTGSTCGTATVALSGAEKSVTGMVQDYGPFSPLKPSVAASDICLHFSAASTLGGLVIYADN